MLRAACVVHAWLGRAPTLSVCPPHTHTRSAAVRRRRMIAYLQRYFQPSAAEPGFSLAIQGGSQGARLTHSHERQYTYVLQSLTLWREVGMLRMLWRAGTRTALHMLCMLSPHSAPSSAPRPGAAAWRLLGSPDPYPRPPLICTPPHPPPPRSPTKCSSSGGWPTQTCCARATTTACRWVLIASH